MSSLTFFLVIVGFQAVVQTTFGQCLGNYPLNGFGNYETGCGRHGFGTTLGYGIPEAIGGYGGEGIGDLDVAGELAVAGITAVAGQVPILGAVQFGGEVPAAGIVTISGRCGCDCNGSPLF
ncbi:PREDICTED: chorion class CA protein ERA.2-like [Papilio polytes]|uniref:chorion class CA protein ERA.2-like n=1 Tax=Papilio polytes TaxID=76194 RepID=UPI0006769FD2|nr:PREDICTED: chorion class CA protein ERA.2-like [Papilio polytes]